MLRVAGVRQADLKGYSFSREDVNARALANAYGQTLGQVFTHEMKPYEVEILVAAGGRRRPTTTSCTTSSTTAPSWTKRAAPCSAVRPRQIAEALETRFEHRARLRRGDPPRRGGARADPTAPLTADQLEVAFLDRTAAAPRVPPHQGRRARSPSSTPADAGSPRRYQWRTTPRTAPSTRDREQRRRDPPQRDPAGARGARRGRCRRPTTRVGAASVASTSSASST